MSAIHQITENKSFNLFIGNMNAAKDLNLMKEKEISFIINIAEETNETSIDHVDLIFGAANDKILEAIAAHIENGNVFIHCQKGEQRAPSIGIMWLKKMTGRTTQEAYDHIKKINPLVSISPFILKFL